MALSVFDIFGMLYSQGAIVIPEEDSFKNPEVWLELIDKYGITIDEYNSPTQDTVDHIKNVIEENKSKESSERHI